MNEIIRNMIIEFILKNDKEKLYKKPIVGFSDSKNIRFRELKNIVSKNHHLPEDLLEDAKSVIVYFIPFKEYIIETNIKGRNTSKEWAETYIETNNLISKTNIYVRDELNKLGFNSTLIPATQHNLDENKLISDWSHRHIADICNIGKFGLNNMLITEKGCCGRLGSIVTNVEIEIGTVDSKEESCLYKYNSSCGLCIERCVNNAMDYKTFDRKRCHEMCVENANIGLAGACGKCMVGLPCSTKDPVKELINTKPLLN